MTWLSSYCSYFLYGSELFLNVKITGELHATMCMILNKTLSNFGDNIKTGMWPEIVILM
jgi:hypothetical protein